MVSLTAINGYLSLEVFFTDCGTTISMVRVFGEISVETGILKAFNSTNASTECRIKALMKANMSDTLNAGSPW